YLQQDNIDTSIWNKAHLSVLTYGGQLMALPAYDGPVAVYYRQDLLDQMGLQYPGPTWTYKEAQSLWTQATRTVNTGGKSQHQYGVQLYNTGYYEQLPWWLHGWGASIMDATGTKCTANSSQGIACLTFLAELSTTNVAQGRSGISHLGDGTCVFKEAGGWDLLPIAQLLGTKVKWNILPNPIWPNGPATFDNIDYYVLNRASKNPDQAWAFLKWVTAEPAYQGFQMRATLVEPCLLSLWDQWLTVAAQTVPLLATKDIHYIADAARQGYAIPNSFFKYSAAQVANVIDNWGAQIWSGQLSPQSGLTQMANQINAIEATGNTISQSVATIQKTFPAKGPSIATVQAGL
ncbi:MAG: extracellular solute-binding protein, partial [Candidatus Dormibacteria bacterium]